MAKKSKKPIFDRAVSAEDAKDLRMDNLQPTENVAILDNPDIYREHSYFGGPSRPSMAQSSVKDANYEHESDIDTQHQFVSKHSPSLKRYTREHAEQDVEGYPVSGDDLAKMRGKSLHANRDRYGYDINNTPEVPPDRASYPTRRPGV
jgi:hypothetical protein